VAGVDVAGAIRTGRIVSRLEELRMFAREQKLFPHFSEAGAAIFTIEQV
jgi:hypothetical protein